MGELFLIEKVCALLALPVSRVLASTLYFPLICTLPEHPRFGNPNLRLDLELSPAFPHRWSLYSSCSFSLLQKGKEQLYTTIFTLTSNGNCCLSDEILFKRVKLKYSSPHTGSTQIYSLKVTSPRRKISREDT